MTKLITFLFLDVVSRGLGRVLVLRGSDNRTFTYGATENAQILLAILRPVRNGGRPVHKMLALLVIAEDGKRIAVQVVFPRHHLTWSVDRIDFVVRQTILFLAHIGSIFSVTLLTPFSVGFGQASSKLGP